MAKKVELPAGYRFLADIMPDLNYVTDKRKSAKAYYTYFLNRVLQMFEYKNLPDSIPHDILDKYLMINGIACITKDPDDKLRVFYGNLGGVQDCYYRPTRFIIANPHFKEAFSKECIVLGEEEHDGVLMRNDMAWFGLHAMLSRYSCLMAENVLTMRVADVLLRIMALLSAPTDKEYNSAMEYIKSLEDGELKVIAENPFFEGIKMQNPPSNNGSYLTQFIELQQYYKGSFYNEIGLSANYNMKREAIGKGESTLDQDALLPLCENMLKARREDLALVNEMYGTEIEVDFSSSWLENMLEAKLILLTQAKEAGFQMKESSTDSPDSPDSPDTPDTPEDISQLSDMGAGEVDESGDMSDQVGGETGQDDEGSNDSNVDEALEKLDEILDEGLESLKIAVPMENMMASQLGIEGGESDNDENSDTE